MWTRIRHWAIGDPLPTQALEGERLTKLQALAAFSPDALSSIAYANEEIYLALVVAGSAGLALTLPVGIAITLLLVLVALSYLQTVHAYPSGGGSYAVTRANLGTLPGLVAAAALLIDYLLTAAVSLTAAAAAISSAFPALWPYKLEMALVFLGLITLANLRGLRETGTLMGIPVYSFIVSYLLMLAYGALRFAFSDPPDLATVAPPPTAPLTTALVLRAFASGCTALSGVEAISNGVPVFRKPESRNAATTLLAMALLMGLLFAGSITLTQGLAVLPGPEETILSALARRLVGGGVLHWLIQIVTMLILAVAANTSFAGFPRLAAVLAEEDFMPHQLRQLGDRLVYANAIFLLALAAAVLIVVFGGDTHALIPLFAVGVFLAFTLSQAGMVMHWWRERGKGWQLKAALNGAGAVATATTMVVVGVSKFLGGAWLTIILIPTLVVFFLQVRSHYQAVRQQLHIRAEEASCPPRQEPRVVIPVSGVHPGVIEAIAYARSISTQVTALYVELEPDSAQTIRALWETCLPDVPLVTVPSPYRSVLKPLFTYLDEADRAAADGQLATVILPEVVPARWWQSVLHNHTASAIRTALLFRRRVLGYQRTIIDVPYHLAR